MRARPAFALSLLAALGIHAVILLVPRAAFVGETKVLPTVVIGLSETPTIMAMSAAAAPAPLPLRSVPRPAPVAVPQAPLQPASAPEPPPAAAPEPPQPEAASFQPADTAPSLSPAPRDGPEQGAAAEAAAAPPAGPTQAPYSTSGSGAAASGGFASSALPASGSGLVTPRPLAQILPAYPRSARQSGAQGLAKVTATLDERGTVTGVELLLSSGNAALDRAALDAVRGAAFTPALQGGKPVPCRITIPIRFQLSAPRR